MTNELREATSCAATAADAAPANATTKAHRAQSASPAGTSPAGASLRVKDRRQIERRAPKRGVTVRLEDTEPLGSKRHRRARHGASLADELTRKVADA